MKSSQSGLKGFGVRLSSELSLAFDNALLGDKDPRYMIGLSAGKSLQS